MGEKTGISWTDSTMNFWIGCTKVGPGCDNCYAVNVAARSGVTWGHGAPRRLTSIHNRNEPRRWQKKAAAFLEANGHPRRVFCSSLADVFDNEVPDIWRGDAFAVMEATPDLRWQICTKRVSNIEKMVPPGWLFAPAFADYSRGVPMPSMAIAESYWPKNVGILITVVTPEEVRRDVPRLIELKRRFGIPWIGLSIEPMVADVAQALHDVLDGYPLGTVDWAIFGGESGPHARDFYVAWMLAGGAVCRKYGVAVFNKQMGSKPFGLGGDPIVLSSPTGKDPQEWPVHRSNGGLGFDMLRSFDFPPALMQ